MAALQTRQTLLLTVVILSDSASAFLAEHIALGCGDPQWRMGGAARHGRLMPRQTNNVGGWFADDQAEARTNTCPRLEPEPVRSVQRVTAVRSARKERCVQKEGKIRTKGRGYSLLPLVPRVTAVAECSQGTVRREKQRNGGFWFGGEGRPHAASHPVAECSDIARAKMQAYTIQCRLYIVGRSS